MPDSFSFALSRLYPSFSVSLAIRAAFLTLPIQRSVCLLSSLISGVSATNSFVLISTGFYLVQLFGIDCLKAVQLQSGCICLSLNSRCGCLRPRLPCLSASVLPPSGVSAVKSCTAASCFLSKLMTLFFESIRLTIT
jgi:hypothetical protein